MGYQVSVIIPTYNYGRYIGEAIESVLKQTYPVAEIIVVDDGSTDETEAIARHFDGRVQYTRQPSSGVCAARNKGVELSKGELIAFLDADDVWEPSKIEKQLAKFDDDSEIGLVHCGMLEFDSETGAMIDIRLEGSEGQVADALLLWESPVINVSGSAVMVSRKAFDDAGKFDPELKVGEDWDFCYRVARKYKVGFVREALVNYRSHAAAAHRNIPEMERGMSRFYQKAFAAGGDVVSLRRRAYGNYHRVMAGSYFQAGNYVDSARHSILSIWNRPRNIIYFFAFPLRRYRRFIKRRDRIKGG